MKPSFLLTLLVILCAGTSSAQRAGPPTVVHAAADPLYSVYLSRDYAGLEKQLDGLDPRDPQRGFFEGQLDAAFLRTRPAEEKLRRFLDLPNTDGDWRKDAWVTLVTTESRAGEYAASAYDSARALADPCVRFDVGERSEMQEQFEQMRALRHVPPQCRTDQSGASTVHAVWSAHQAYHGAEYRGGWVHVDFRVNGLTESALFDTDATFNVASESFARLHRLHLLPLHASIRSITGQVVSTQLGVADEVQIGQMTFEHVVFLVMQDRDLAFLGDGYSAIVGLPLILSFGRLRMVLGDNDHLEIGLPPPDAGPVDPVQGRNLAYDRWRLLVPLDYHDAHLPFVLDTGATVTTLFAGFCRRFPEVLLGSKRPRDGDKAGSYGAGTKYAKYLRWISQLTLGVDHAAVLFHEVPVVGQPIHGAALSGRAGGDLLAGGYELDFHRMRFSLLDGNRSNPPASP